MNNYWSFEEKTSVKQDLICIVCANFQRTFLHLVSWTPTDEASGQVDIFVKIFGQVDLCSDVPPKDEALGEVDIWSDFWSG